MRSFLIITGLVIVVAGSLYLARDKFFTDSDMSLSSASTYVVKRGRLKVTITEAASLEAAKSEVIRSEIEGRTTILSLIEEGTHVKKGQKVAELDVSNLIDRSETQEINESRAAAALVTAEKNLEIQRNQNASDLEAADNKLLFAKLEHEKFTGRKPAGGQEATMGEKEQQLTAARADIQITQEELKRAKTRLAGTERLFAKKYANKQELEADRINVLKAENQVTLAKNRLFILENYTLNKNERQLQADVKEASAELERTKLRCSARLAQQEAEFSSKRQQADFEKAKLVKLKTQIKAGIVYAPADGLVVFVSRGRGMRQSPIEEGTELRQGQSMIILPDVTTMMVKAGIHETQIDKVSVGQKVTMKVDTFPDRVFFGSISRVSVVPDSQSSWFSPEVKLYTTYIDLDGDTSMLKPGQSCTIEVRVADLQDVLSVPVSAVHRQKRVLYVWKARRSGPIAVVVETGISNDKFVLIRKGVQEGDAILLSEPEAVKTPDFSELNEKLKAAEAKKENEIRNWGKARPGSNGDSIPSRGTAMEGSARRREGGGRRGGSNRRRSRELSPEEKSLLADIKQRFPQLAGEMRSLWSLRGNEELKDAVEGDADLGPRYKAIIDKARERRRGGQGSGGMRGGEGRSGGRERSRGERGGGRRGR